MIQKLLAWSALGLALLFVVLSLTIMFAGGSLGASALSIAAPIAIGSLALAILLAVGCLVMALVQ
jgi:UDP-N-acetylglucosamine:LPS N-acetylglucosamine transferase